MAKKTTIKVIGITKNDCITGIEYGTVEILVPSEKLTKTPCSHDMTEKHTLSGPSKSVRHSIKQPALKWANKISAAKKRMLDAQKEKQK